MIDLAGSERASDPQGHDKARLGETKAINSSLSTLKDCIRARELASQTGMGGNTHVPYHRSKLTLLMKNVFEVGCTRLCLTVVLATCSPLASDISHSSNTLKYSSPLRAGADMASAKQKKGVKMEVDASDPALWSNAQVVEWVTKSYPTLANPSVFEGELRGSHLCALPEKDFYSRVENAGIMASSSFADSDHPDSDSSTKLAKDIYLAVWTLIADANDKKGE